LVVTKRNSYEDGEPSAACKNQNPASQEKHLLAVI
jgi:hypothetical protein